MVFPVGVKEVVDRCTTLVMQWVLSRQVVVHTKAIVVNQEVQENTVENCVEVEVQVHRQELELIEAILRDAPGLIQFQ